MTFKKDIDSNTIIVGDFNSPLSKMDRSSKQSINKDIAALNNVLDQMDLTNVYRTFPSKEAKYTFFSNAHGILSKKRILWLIQINKHVFLDSISWVHKDASSFKDINSAWSQQKNQ